MAGNIGRYLISIIRELWNVRVLILDLEDL